MVKLGGFRHFNLKLTNALLTVGFTQSAHDYSLFTLKRDEGLVIILVYVDDLLITGNNEQMITKAKANLHHQLKLKDIGELKYFLGIEVLRSSKGVILNQRKYIVEFQMQGSLVPSLLPLLLNQT